VAVVPANMDSKMTVITSRLDSIEAHMNQFPANSLDDTTGKATQTAGIEKATRAFMALEQEREEIRVHSHNFVVSGLLPSTSFSDIELSEQLCEQHLTVKHHFIRVRRLGKDKTSPSAKLCVTLESSDAVDDLIASSSMLRQLSDQGIRRIFFNRDLTPQQSDIALKNRTVSDSSGINLHAASFPAL